MTHVAQIGSMSSGPVACTLQDAGDTVTAVAHGLADGTRVRFVALLGTTGVVTNTEYFVVSATADTFQVSSTSGGAARPLTTNGSGTFVWRDVIVGSTNAVEDYFGSAIDASADYLVIGAPGNDDGGNGAGAAFVFEKSGSTWVEVAKFLGKAAGAYFGSAVAVGGDVIAIGAHNADSYGAVYVYKRLAGTWAYQQKLISPVAQAAFDNFGRAVAISADGGVIIAGKPANTGGAYAYHYNSGTGQWDHVTGITAADVAAGDTYGESVAVSADGLTCVVGSPFDDDTAADSGSVYVFNYAGGWSQTAKLAASDAAASDYFGASVGISADGTVIAGAAPRDDDGGSDAGAVYIFELTGTWSQTAKLVSYIGPAQSNYLGFRGSLNQSDPGHQRIVFVDTTTILVPSNFDSFYGGAYSGACRCFVAAPSWAEGYLEYAIFPNDAVAWLRFGACGLSGDELIVGRAYSATTGSGEAYRTTDLPWASGGEAPPTSTDAYLMQACDSVTGALYYWTSATADWAAAGYPGPNSATEIAVSGRVHEET